MKKLSVVLLALATTFTITACGNKDDGGKEAGSNP